jgi:hypothetical protein
MLATQDVYDLEVPEEDTRNRRERLIAKCHVLSLLQLSLAQDAAEFAATDDYQEDGAATPIDWIRFNCHLTGPAAADYVSAGEHFAELPQTVLAMAEGKIGFGHLVVMARTARALAKSASARPFDERRLLKQALENSVGKFHHICRHARHAADPKGYAATEADLVENRSLSISTDTDDGAVFLNCVLDPAGGATVRTALEALAHRSGAGDDRAYDRRMADGLVDMAMHALDNGLVPQNASQRTHRDLWPSFAGTGLVTAS